MGLDTMMTFRLLPLVLLTTGAALVGSSMMLADRHADPTDVSELVELQRRVCSKFFRLSVSAPRGKPKPQTLLDALERCREFEEICSEAQEVAPDMEVAGHPINVFYLYSLWARSAATLKSHASISGDREVALFADMLPGLKELKDVTLSILRLQRVYNLTTGDLMEGVIKEVPSARPLDKDDCFLVTLVAREALMRDTYRDWHTACVDQFVKYEVEREARDEELREGLEEMDQEVGDLAKDENKVKELQKKLPLDLMAEIPPPKNGTSEDTEAARRLREEREGSEDLFAIYRRLCQSTEESTSLLPREEKCLYYELGEDEAFGRLAPAKLEFLAYDPVVAVVHDAIPAGRADELRRTIVESRALAEPRSVSSNSGEVLTTAGRTGKVGFLPRAPEDVGRSSAMYSGLSMQHAEPLQVVSYGVGGHYEPHVDYIKLSEASRRAFGDADTGDRTATLLYYLSDVEAGGATVFPRIGLGVRPIKGSALFWYNLYRNGTGDPYTMHAACPVLLGSKWVANQWFRDLAQDSTRPCDLSQES